MKRSPSTAPSEQAIKELLQRYECPTSFAAVRAIFMGAIASPEVHVSPMTTLQSLWNGDLPKFQSPEAFEVLADALLTGLWNRLAKHQDRRTPFRLTRELVPVTRADLLALALLRTEELSGFVDGLYGDADELELPEKAHAAVDKLVELHGMFEAAATLLGDKSQPAPQQELAEFARNGQVMTRIAEELINKTIQSCKRARVERLKMEAAVPTEEDEPLLVESSLSQQVTRHGVSVNVEIYGDGEGRWILEVVDQQGTSHIWDERFATDEQALAEAIRALEQEPMEFVGGPDGQQGVH